MIFSLNPEAPAYFYLTPNDTKAQSVNHPSLKSRDAKKW